jgi:hypothetical protein
MQPTEVKEVVMRPRWRRNGKHPLALDPRAVRVTEREILDDLLYPAPARAQGKVARSRK